MNKSILYREALKQWGIDAQVDMVIEEMAELTKGLCKHNRNASAETLKNVIEEIADVEIMIEQLKEIVDSKNKKVPSIKKLKLLRLQKRLEIK